MDSIAEFSGWGCIPVARWTSMASSSSARKLGGDATSGDAESMKVQRMLQVNSMKMFA